MCEPAIEARRIFAAHATSSGAVVALQGLSLAIERGELVAVLGPSGSGKSTLMRCLGGTQRPLAGELRAFGLRLHDASQRALGRWRARHVGIVGQHYARTLSGDLRVLQLVALPAQLRGVPARTARHRAHELLERTGMGDRLHARRTELSGGQQQRVALCAALAPQPSLLLADEITGQLDERAGAAILALLRELASERGVTIVLATHDPKASAHAHRALTVRDGRVTAELRGDGERVATIDESGLVRLEGHDLDTAGIRARAKLDVAPGRIVLRRIGGAPPPRAPAPPPAPAAVGPVAGVVLRGVRKTYGSGPAAVEALPPLDLELARPGLHALVAPSGSGKSTLLSLIAGLERPSAGEILVAGERLDGRSRDALAALRRRHVAIVPQGPALAGHLTALENVALAPLVRGRRPGAAEAALADVGLGELTGRRVAELSGGERQRVAVARALASEPAVLLADEPTANLDELNAIGVARLLARLALARGMVVLCATHDASVIAEATSVVRLGAAA